MIMLSVWKMFCDAQDIKLACNDMNILDPLHRFFGYLLNFNTKNYAKETSTIMTDDSLVLMVMMMAMMRWVVMMKVRVQFLHGTAGRYSPLFKFCFMCTTVAERELRCL